MGTGGGHRKTLKLGVVYTPVLPAFERPRQEGPKFKATSVSKVSVSLAMMSTLWRLRQDCLKGEASLDYTESSSDRTQDMADAPSWATLGQ